MLAKEFATRMKKITQIKSDIEKRHIEADTLLIKCLRDIGFGEGADYFDNMLKWYA